MIVDYMVRRNELTKKGFEIRLPLDIMVAVMIVSAFLVVWIIGEVIIEPYRPIHGAPEVFEPMD